MLIDYRNLVQIIRSLNCNSFLLKHFPKQLTGIRWCVCGHFIDKQVTDLQQQTFVVSLLGLPGPLSMGLKRPGCEADHSPPSSPEVKYAWNYTSTPTIHLYGVALS